MTKSIDGKLIRQPSRQDLRSEGESKSQEGSVHTPARPSRPASQTGLSSRNASQSRDASHPLDQIPSPAPAPTPLSGQYASSLGSSLAGGGPGPAPLPGAVAEEQLSQQEINSRQIVRSIQGLAASRMTPREKQQFAQDNLRLRPESPTLQATARQASVEYSQATPSIGDIRAVTGSAVQGAFTSSSVYGWGRNSTRNIVEAGVKLAGIPNAQAESLVTFVPQLLGNETAGFGKSFDTHVLGQSSAPFVHTPNAASTILPEASLVLANEISERYGADIRADIGSKQADLKKASTYKRTGQAAFALGAFTNVVLSKVADVLIPNTGVALGVKIAVGISAPAVPGGVVGAVKGTSQGRATIQVPTPEGLTTLHGQLLQEGRLGSATEEEIDALPKEKHNLFYSRKRSREEIASDKDVAATKVPRGAAIVEGISENQNFYRKHLFPTSVISTAGSLVATGLDLSNPYAGTAIRAASNAVGIAVAIPGLFEGQPELAVKQQNIRNKQDQDDLNNNVNVPNLDV